MEENSAPRQFYMKTQQSGCSFALGCRITCNNKTRRDEALVKDCLVNQYNGKQGSESLKFLVFLKCCYSGLYERFSTQIVAVIL